MYCHPKWELHLHHEIVEEMTFYLIYHRSLYLTYSPREL